jgi:hypothetical protein
MKAVRTPLAKILNHSSGLGAPSPDDVRQRAFEIARIDGRTDFTEADWQQARLELHGGHPAYYTDGDGDMITVSERDMLIVDVGHHVQNLREDESENAVELVAEGMDEAMHEQMLYSARAHETDG